MNRRAIALAPLILAAGAFSAHAQDPHAGHNMTPPPGARPATPAPDPHAGHQMPAAAAARDAHVGHVMPPARTPVAADPHAGHHAPVQPVTVDTHAGHNMTPPPGTRPATPAPDPHAGHQMPAVAAARDAHVGHVMPPARTPVAADPHAGHHAPVQPVTVDPHAGHDMSAMTHAPIDPHAGHDMSTMSMGPPDVPTSADNPGREPEAPAPPAALGGPVHAADLVFGTDVMAASRRTLLRENGDVRTTAIIIDRLEAGFGDDETGLWDVQGWSGGDINRFWWKSEGEGTFGDGIEEAELQGLYSRAVSPFWDVQAGVRQDWQPDGEDTTYLVLGVQGLAAHWWEIDAAAFLSTDGDLSARVEAEYDQRLTQRWILQPRVEIEASARDNPTLGTGSGLTSIEAGLRLRYEVRKELAPYVGIEWSRAFNGTANYIEAAGGDPEAVRIVIGLKAWF